MGANVYQKIVTIKEVKSIVEGLKQSGKTCVHVHGCFDLLHYGHLKFFEKAKEYGDTLIVSLTPDKYIFKGPGRPMFDQHQRTNYIANIEIVDYVVLNDQEDCVDFLLEVSPNISARGIEYKELDNDVTGKISIEKSALESVGGKMIFIDEIVFSSTKIINIYQEHLTEEQHRYRDYLNKHIQLEDIDKVMLLIQQLNVLIVGETIFDEYIYCSVLGTVSKHSAISSSFHHRQFMQGGGLAVAKHLASLADSVKFITINGKKNDEDLIFDVKDTASLGVIAVSDPDNYTTLKRRYIASGYPSPMSGEMVEDFVDTNNRLFEINYLPDNILSDSVKQELLTQMQNQITQSDIVLVTDFGHGMFDDEIINKIEEQNKFIAINVQTNSSNLVLIALTKSKIR